MHITELAAAGLQVYMGLEVNQAVLWIPILMSRGREVGPGFKSSHSVGSNFD